MYSRNADAHRGVHKVFGVVVEEEGGCGHGQADYDRPEAPFKSGGSRLCYVLPPVKAGLIAEVPEVPDLQGFKVGGYF